MLHLLYVLFLKPATFKSPWQEVRAHVVVALTWTAALAVLLLLCMPRHHGTEHVARPEHQQMLWLTPPTFTVQP